MSLGPQNPRMSKNEISPNQDLIEIFDASAGTMKVVTPSSLGEAIPTGSLKIDGDTIDGTLRYVVDKDGTQSPLKLSTDRLGIDADPTVTLQQVAVIESLTTNAGIVLKPNGTGAIMAQVPDGTATGGNARGQYAVDLQRVRSGNSQVAGGIYDVIVGGRENSSTTNPNGYSFIGGGRNNRVLYGGHSVIVGGLNNTVNQPFGTGASAYHVIGGGSSNTTSSLYATISGGESNTASTNTHATVVGGQSNTSSGLHSISGGLGSTASGQRGIALGGYSTASGGFSLAIGDANTASGTKSVVLGADSRATQTASVAIGNVVYSEAENSFVTGNRTLGYLYGQNANASGRFTGNGDAQQSLLTARKQDTIASATTTVLSLDGTGTTNLIIPNGNNRAWNVTVKWVAVCTATGSGTTAVGAVAIATDSFMFKRVSGTSSIGSVQNLQNSQDATMAGATCSYAVGGSQDLQITFTAPASANATTFRVVAKVELTECAW